jgi:integrase
MARRPRSSTLETRTSRLKLPVQKAPHDFTTLAPGIALGYRRCKGAGRWIVRVADGKGSSWQKGFAIADDFEDANGEGVLDFWQAQGRAKQLARGTVESGRPLTVSEALDAYAADLKARDGLAGNVSRVRHHLPPSLAAKPVSLLTAHELRHWRDGLDLKPATINRTTRQLKAALNLAQRLDPTRISNTHAWKVGLASLRDTHRPRNAVLSDEQVRKLVAAAYSIDPAFGLYTETAAVTGARPSQLVKLEVGDLQSNGDGPRLMVPSSRKGHAGKAITRKPVPITAGLALKLRAAAGNRDVSAPLLLRADGEPWSATSADHRRPFEQVVARVRLKPSVTFYSLRHSSIVRQILAGAPLRVIADAHDTSTKEIERTYSHFIGDHADAVLRKGLLDTTAQPAAAHNVVALPGARR